MAEPSDHDAVTAGAAVVASLALVLVAQMMQLLDRRPPPLLEAALVAGALGAWLVAVRQLAAFWSTSGERRAPRGQLAWCAVRLSPWIAAILLVAIFTMIGIGATPVGLTR